LWAPKSLQMMTSTMKSKDACSLEESYDQTRQHIKKQKHYFANESLSSQSYGFPSSHIWMKVSETYVARRMNTSVKQALTGKQINQVKI